jgi:DUF971 family protein
MFSDFCYLQFPVRLCKITHAERIRISKFSLQMFLIFQDLTALNIRITNLKYVTPRTLCQCFGGTYSFHLHGWRWRQSVSRKSSCPSRNCSASHSGKRNVNTVEKNDVRIFHIATLINFNTLCYSVFF